MYKRSRQKNEASSSNFIDELPRHWNFCIYYMFCRVFTWLHQRNHTKKFYVPFYLTILFSMEKNEKKIFRTNNKKFMPKRQFGDRFFDHMNDEGSPSIPARLCSTGRSRSNNSLAGVEFSNHVVPHKIVKTYVGERRHIPPSGTPHLKGESMIKSPLQVRQHRIRIVPEDAPQRQTHILPTSTGLVGATPPRTNSASRRGYCPPPLPASEGTPLARRGSPCRRDGNRDSLDFALVPKAYVVERPIPEPLLPSKYRRQRRSLMEPGSSDEARSSSASGPKSSHRALIDPPPHAVPAPARRGSIVMSDNHIAVGSFEPTSENRLRPARAPSPLRGDRDYDVITLLARGSTYQHSTPQRSDTPTRTTRKNQCSSPNILAWA